MKLIQTFRNIFRLPDLRKRVLFTLGLLGVYRLGSHIPTPGINTLRWEESFSAAAGSLFGFFDLLSGGSFRKLTIFALGIMPYITASIILQLLTVVVPTLERLQKEGEVGRRKITQWTRYLAILLAAVQAFGVALGLEAMPAGVVVNPGVWFVLQTMISLMAGTAFIMWLGERISERGIGNGMSLIIFAGIVVGLPHAIGNIYRNTFVTHEWGPLTVIVLALMMIAVVAFIVTVERSERRILVQYARRSAGRTSAGGQATHMPLKLNAGGVIPVIFASSILAFPQTLAMLPAVRNMGWLEAALRSIRHGEPLYYLLFVAAILFFCFFYVSIIFNPNEAADNMRRYGSFVPGIRPGRPTADYVNDILTRITVVGGLYLAILCLIPDIMIAGIKLNHLALVGDWFDRVAPRFLLDGLNVQFGFGGTSLLIVVGVAMDTISQIEAQLVMRHYEGFTPGSRRMRRRG
jgi:preprotein translocase subunit SecY